MVEEDALVPVVILALIEETVLRSPVVILHDPVSNQVLPIWVGEPEARAIGIAYQGVKTPRPLTHELFVRVFEGLGATLTAVHIDRVERGTFFATLFFELDDGMEVSLDARPSDSIALALEAEAPIFLAQSVLDKTGQPNPFPSEMDVDSGTLATVLTPKLKDEEESRSSESAPSKKLVQPEFSKQQLDSLRSLLDSARLREFDDDESASAS